ncbi:MAG: FAD-dependent oxidoreductase, partial [Candidatus Brocadiia bacterium]
LGRRRGDFGCEVPYRCLVPLRVDNLLVACRGVSLTQDAHYQMRMMRDMQRVGEAAGVAAALCALLGYDPAELPIDRVQERLFATGALGPPKADRSPGAEVALHWPGAFPEGPERKPPEQWAEELSSDDPRQAVWMLMQQGEAAAPALHEAVRSEDEDVRFWASVPLAMLGSREAAGPLLRALEQRRLMDTEAPATAPAWVTAAVLLGRLGDERAVPALEQVLSEDVPTDVYVAVLRALGRIGEPAAAPAVRRFLERTDIDTRQKLAGHPWQGPVHADVRWRLELAAAEALARMGQDVDDLIEPYLADERRPVRRRARALADIRGLGAAPAARRG